MTPARYFPWQGFPPDAEVPQRTVAKPVVLLASSKVGLEKTMPKSLTARVLSGLSATRKLSHRYSKYPIIPNHRMLNQPSAPPAPAARGWKLAARNPKPFPHHPQRLFRRPNRPLQL